ncbi:MAG: chemotaxis protein CheW [Planctomycetes bacterium]|nr:chemotaxis protein CheW [Planctomycetota bacterium]
MSTTLRETGGASAALDNDQFLTFRLASEEYAVPILRVQEIKGYSAVTPIPNAPSYIKGVMNLRGTVMPVLDLRAKFGFEATEFTKFTVIIVVNVGAKVVGLVVDGVSDVLKFDHDAIEPPPTLGGDLDTSHLTGMAKQGERLVALLDLERIVGLESLSR